MSDPVRVSPKRGGWLNGWPLMEGNRSVLIGTGVHCSGCGRDFGVTCVSFAEGWVAPEKLPDWPFEQDGCPICSDLYAEKPAERGPPTIDERLAAFKAAQRRREGLNDG